MSKSGHPPSDSPTPEKPRIVKNRRGPLAQLRRVFDLSFDQQPLLEKPVLATTSSPALFPPGPRLGTSTEEVIEDAAIGWPARLRAADVTDAERANFAQWLWNDARHKSAFDQLTELWGSLGTCKSLPAPRTRKLWLPLAQAASVFLVLGFALVVQFGQSQFQSETGEQVSSTLSDGSHIVLNTESEINVAFTNASRQVHLVSGELYVDVTRNPARPFVVRSQQGSATAVGTGFSVQQLDDATIVRVEEGIVAVNNQVNDLLLTAGDMAIITNSHITVSQTDIASAHAWRYGRLVYDSVPLSALIDDLNRYLPKRMTISDDELAGVIVSATLELQDQASMLEALSEILDLNWHILSDNLIIIQNRT